MKTATTILGLALVMMIGCGSSVEDPPANMRGDAGPAGGGSGGSAGVSGQAGIGAGGSSIGGAGGAATGGSTGGAGGAAGGSSGGGAGGAAAALPCSVYSWQPTAATACTKTTSPGVTLIGYKDGHQCGICRTPTRPASAPDCTYAATDAICVVACDECAFQ